MRWAAAIAAVALLGGCTATAPASSGSAASQGSGPGSFPASSAAVSTGSADRAGRSDAVLASTLAQDAPGCSAAAAVDGEIVWAGARGLANLADRTPLTIETRFDIGSVSKQFTATAVLLLSLEGALNVHDPISTYVPGLPGLGRPGDRRPADPPHQRHPGLRAAAHQQGHLLHAAHHPAGRARGHRRRAAAAGPNPAEPSTTPTPTTCSSPRSPRRRPGNPWPTCSPTGSSDH